MILSQNKGHIHFGPQSVTFIFDTSVTSNYQKTNLNLILH